MRKIPPDSMESKASSSRTGERVYLGLSVGMLDQKQAIPFLAPDRERLLEYDISRAIARVMTTEKPVIGVMSPLPVMGETNPMMMQMRQQRSAALGFHRASSSATSM